MYLSPPRDHERRSDVGDLAPVEGNEAHTEARHSPKELVDDEVLCKGSFGSLVGLNQEERYALGAIQHTHEKKDKPTNKKPGRKVHRNTPVET